MSNDEDLYQPSILIVDDNVKNLQILGGFLQNEGMAVEFALDGFSALSWLEKKKFDLILLDIMMPGMDGFEVCLEIKKNPDYAEIPIIFITAKTDTESIVRGFDSGAVDYITKPFIKSELLVRVKTQLKIKKSQEEIIQYVSEIEERNRNISDSIEYAKYIQNAILSTSGKNLKYLSEHFILNLPKDILSGDFFWICRTDNKFIIAVMDCTGHGVPGALMSTMGITLLNETVLNEHILQPNKILESLRSKIIQSLGQKMGNSNIKDGIIGSIISFDPWSNKLFYSGAFYPLILIHNNEIFDIKADRIPIGYYEKDGNFTLHEIEIEKEDNIYLFTDGIVDQFGGPKNKRFRVKHLKELLLRNHKKTMIQQKDTLQRELNEWKGNLVQTDDILIFGIRF
jgi:phosphoserine phosphatase RsbU/P